MNTPRPRESPAIRRGEEVKSASSSPARRRADAQRNIEAILDAALVCLTADRHASVADIAQRAGVGRMTLYGHFSTRADLLEAVFARLLAHCEDVLGGVDLDGDPAAALRRLVGSSWQLVHQFHAVRQAAELELPEERIRAHHDQPMRRVEELIARGRDAGAFRRDLPTSWLITVVYSILHAAADDCAAGRLDTDRAPHVITATLLSVLAVPTGPGS